ncbi:MAG: zinc ribbon domain-containing protein [Candidatus Lokiarchaeota archaeon]|nr:zinc ribbon domain-containing protein [Candidatus Lokiarchaeota archaeon]
MKNYAYSLASSALGAITVTLIFGLLAEFLLGWQWWIYMIIAFSWIGFVGAILRFLILEGKKCPQCNSNVSRDTKFCKNCGYQFYKECPKCRKMLRSGARFCDECGAQIE